MNRLVRKVNARLYDLSTISELPKNRPYAIFDLDGTLTKGNELLLATFVKDRNVQVGDASVKGNLVNAFEDYEEGKLRYEKYLKLVGRLYAKMLAKTGETREHVIEVCQQWFDATGHQEIEAYALPMMSEVERFRFNRFMLTGAPAEIALPFASHLGIENVSAMMADVDPRGVYTGIMRDDKNTGLLGNKGDFCGGLNREHPVGLGVGDTASDKVIADTAMHQNADNPLDVKGRSVIMISDPAVLEIMATTAQHYINRGKLELIFKGWGQERKMEVFRAVLRGILKDNHKFELLNEIEGVRLLSPDEKRQLKASRDAMENQWD